MAFTVLVFFMMFHVDLHRVIQRKNQAQNAGDAAALATARWQGATLNLIGELNLLHVLALAVPDPDAVDAITNMQARLNFTGPLAALYAAQVAAKNNRIYVDPALTTFYKQHAETIRDQYGSTLNANNVVYFTEPWPGAWKEYSDILFSICDDGLAAGPDNARFYSDPGGGHILFNKEFYEAVLGASWCWFFLFHGGVQEAYQASKQQLPEMEEQDYTNSEIFGLGLYPLVMSFEAGGLPHGAPPRTTQQLEQDIEDADLEHTPPLVYRNPTNSVEIWYMYNRPDWMAWDDIKPDGDMMFPATGDVRPHYDYVGADAVLRVSATVDRIMPEGGRGATASSTVNWTAAAKPFGYLSAYTGKVLPNSAGLVLPAFHDVRLIPADTASNSDAFSSDVEWVRHLKDHLPRGKIEPGCAYCGALVKWEVESFRQAGVDWLKENSHRCKLPSGPGTRRGGGSRRGH